MSEITIGRRGFIVASASLALSPAAAAAPYSAPLHLTFDDGPDSRLTGALLDVLGVYQMTATFFVVGNRVSGNGHLLRRMIDEGHSVGNHTWSHPDLMRGSVARALSQIDRTSLVIEDETGQRPSLFRPPYGSLSRHFREIVERERGLRTVMWDVDPLDWQNPGAQAIEKRVMAGARPGAIVLLHDIHQGTAAAVAPVCAALTRTGLASVSLR